MKKDHRDDEDVNVNVDNVDQNASIVITVQVPHASDCDWNLSAEATARRDCDAAATAPRRGMRSQS